MRISLSCFNALQYVFFCILLSGFLVHISASASPLFIPNDPSYKPQAFSTSQLPTDAAKLLQETIASKDSGFRKRKIPELLTLAGQLRGEAKGHLLLRTAYLQIAVGDRDAAESSFQEIADGSIKAAEADKVEAQLRVAYFALSHGDVEEAIAAFSRIASPDSIADVQTATDAALRVAFLHRRAKDTARELGAFRQIAKKCPLRAEAAYAKLQLAGLLWEIGKGHRSQYEPLKDRVQFLKDSSVECLQIMNDPDIPYEIRLIAKLIHAENYYFQKDYKSAIPLIEEIISDNIDRVSDSKDIRTATYTIYNTPARQVITAMGWQAMCYYYTGDYESCISVCKEINSGSWKSSDPYRNFNVFGYAYLFEALANEKLGNQELAEELHRVCRQKYPSWYDGIGVSKMRKMGLEPPMIDFSMMPENSISQGGR